MISEISLVLTDELDNIIKIPSKNIEMKIELCIAESFTAINKLLNDRYKDDEEMRIAQKFYFADSLQIYLREISGLFDPEKREKAQ